MKFTLEMIQTLLVALRRAARREVVPLGPARYLPGPAAGAQDPAYDDGDWGRLGVGDRWGGAGQTCWLRVPVRVPPSWAGAKVALHIALSDYEHLSGPEALAYLDGVPVQGIDFYHRDLLLGNPVRGDEQYLLALEAYSSLLPGPQTLRALELVRLDPDAEGIYHDLRVLHGALLTMPEDSLDRARLLRVLEHAHRTLDLRRTDSEEYLRSARAAREILWRDAFGRGEGEVMPRTVAVGHAHIDLAWLWPVAQTRRKGARTFSTVLKLMEQYPAYHFVCSQPALYQMVKEDEPALYGRVKERIAEGRWEPIGASWVEMDCNLAGAEALVRQFLYGKRFFRDELGADPRVLWLPDVFGYSAALPQVMKGCEVDYFMTTKISWNEYNRLPYDTFRWRGIDGTEVLTHMVTSPLNPQELFGSTMQPFYTYNAKFTPYDVAGNWSAYRQKDVNDELLYLFGYGDGGGGPTAEMQETATRLAALPGFVHVEQSSAKAFFSRLERRVWDDPNLPTWVGELYLEYHRGTYTSQAWIKRANRQAELLYREAELWAAAAAPLVDAAALAEWQRELRAGWESLLFNQFHDILPGSSIPQVYADARVDFHAILMRGQRVRDAARQALAASAGSAALVAFNPAPFERADPVELLLPADAALPALRDASGAPVTVQEIGHDEQGRRVLVSATAPPLGYCAYEPGTAESAALPHENAAGSAGFQPAPASQSAGGGPAAGELRIERDLLENRFFRVQLDERAHIVSLYDKRAGREVIAAGEAANRLIAFEDRPLNFDAWDINIYYADKPSFVDDVTSWRVVETGPLRGGVEVVRRYGDSTITQRILLHAEVPRIDFPTTVDWREHQVLLKAAFPVAVNSPRATFEIQWGNVERPTHWNTSWDWARFETCAHKWIDLSEGGYGVSLLNDCKYGHDVKGHVMRLTLLKSGIYPDPEADQGYHEFSYALLPHQGDWRDGETVRHAYLFNMPASALLLSSADSGVSARGGAAAGAGASGGVAAGATRSARDDAPLPNADRSGASGALSEGIALVTTDRPGLVIETVKPAEDGDGLIVRVYDAHNSRGPASLTFARPIASAEETNMLEAPAGPVEYSGRTLRFEARPYGISTFRVRLSAL